jgi:hypothetical protein
MRRSQLLVMSLSLLVCIRLSRHIKLLSKEERG